MKHFRLTRWQKFRCWIEKSKHSFAVNVIAATVVLGQLFFVLYLLSLDKESMLALVLSFVMLVIAIGVALFFAVVSAKTDRWWYSTGRSGWYRRDGKDAT